MDKESSKKSGAEKSEAKTTKAMREFAKTYNDFKGCPLMHDLVRMLSPHGKPLNKKQQQRFLKRKVERYRAYSRKHHDLHLPELILRTFKDGRMIAIPPGVEKQLAEYRIDIKKVLKAKGVIVTSAQFGATLNKDVWQSFKRYAEHMGYALVVLTIKYGAVKTVYQKELQQRVLTSTFDQALKGHILFDGLELADGMLGLNVTRLRPTLDTFLTDKICHRGGNATQIFAAPKLELEFRPRVQHDYPKAIMTTGAVTHPNYSVDNLGQQDRTGEIAAAEHTYSAIVVEFSAKKTFHFRQLLANTAGEFYDIDPIRGGAVLVTPNGIEHRPDDVEAAYLGDWHSGVTHPDVKQITFCEMAPKLKPKKIIVSDFFNGHSITHHDEDQALRRAHKATHGLDSLEGELNGCVDDFKWMHKKAPFATLYSLASNHNDVLAKYIGKRRWKDDFVNMEIAARIFAALCKDLKDRKPPQHELMSRDPFHWWINQHAPFVKTIGRRDLLILPESKDSKKILCSLHGDIGPGGGKAGGMKVFEKWNQWSMIGHAHAPGIKGSVWRVGTSTYLSEHYVNGPRTSWNHTHGLIYANGQRQLINIVNGAWHGQRKVRPKSAGVGAEAKRGKKRRKQPAKAA